MFTLKELLSKCMYNITFFFNSALVEFKDGSLEVNEGEQFKEICLNTRGYNFSVKLVATYDDNTTSGIISYHSWTNDRE